MQTQNNSHNLSRLNIDNIKPKWVTCIWLFFFALMAILFLLVLAVPESIYISPQERFICPDDVQSSEYCHKKFDINPDSPNFSDKFPVFVKGVSNRNQFIIVTLEPVKNAAKIKSKFELDIEFQLSVYELQGYKEDSDDPLYEGPTHEISTHCSHSDDVRCDNRTLVYVNQIKHSGYLFLFDVKNAEDLHEDGIETFNAYVTKVNPEYTDFLLALRYVCLAISIIFVLYYWRSLRQMRGEKLVFEQKFIRVLGILLILFNDPICASTILSPTLASAVISSMFVITFVCALLLFWIAAFQRIYRDNNQVHTKALSWPKLVYIALLWLFSVVAYCILSREYLNDPSFDFNDEYDTAFTAFKVIMIILLGVGLAWMFFGFAQILKRYNDLIWRHKIFFSFSCYFIFCYFVFMFTGSINVYNLNGTKVMLVFGITNIYIWFLQILYSPYGKGAEGPADRPMSLAEGIKEFQGYEVLDENSMREGGLMYDDHPEERSPDQIVFQIDNKGNSQGNNNVLGNNNMDNNFDNFGNFGSFGKSVENNNDNFGFNLEMANRGNQDNQDNQENSPEHKYPYELGNDD